MRPCQERRNSSAANIPRAGKGMSRGQSRTPLDNANALAIRSGGHEIIKSKISWPPGRTVNQNIVAARKRRSGNPRFHRHSRRPPQTKIAPPDPIRSCPETSLPAENPTQFRERKSSGVKGRAKVKGLDQESARRLAWRERQRLCPAAARPITIRAESEPPLSIVPSLDIRKMPSIFPYGILMKQSPEKSSGAAKANTPEAGRRINREKNKSKAPSLRFFLLHPSRFASKRKNRSQRAGCQSRMFPFSASGPNGLEAENGNILRSR